ncbi:MAG: hypothetical protein Q8O48_03580, partial [Anaerolineales bacterium]|nr:hypothetical protein [Anaerolineales bacterium]
RPLIFFLIMSALMIMRMWNLILSPDNVIVKRLEGGGFKPDTILVTIPLLMLPIIGWMVWEYIDWKNDIYLVNPVEIVDLDKTPLGTEERRSAQLENILSTEYKRMGLTGYLLNFGTVFISVGGSNLEFQDVLDPAGVQADINRRRMARLARNSEDTVNVERERMAAWLAAYHQNLKEFDVPATAMEDDDMNKIGFASQTMNDNEIDDQIDNLVDNRFMDDMDF